MTIKAFYLTITFLIISISVKGQTYKLDVKASSIEWIGYGEIGSFEQRGTIKAKQGQITLNEEKLESGFLILNMNSIDHQDKQLKKHLKAEDFFDVKQFPTAQFIIKSINQKLVSGLLSLKGKENIETFSIQMIKRENKLTIQANITVDRTKYDIKYNSSSYFQDLGNYAIKNEVDLVMTLLFIHD